MSSISPPTDEAHLLQTDSMQLKTLNGEEEANFDQETQGHKIPNIVDWEGPSDLANPQNWKSGVKLAHVLLVSAFTLYSNLAAVMFAPGAAALCTEFGITNSVVAALTVSIYILGFALGPLFISPMSEIYGRLIVYHVGNFIYIGFTIGCALSTNASTFLVFRFICGIAAASPMSIGGGTVADIYPPKERGKAMALFGLGPLLGPIIGPVIGGFVTQNLGWRWTFWLVLILASIVTAFACFIMRETYEPVLLDRKAAEQRKVTGNENLRARTFIKEMALQHRLARAIIRPIKILMFSPIVLLPSIYSAFLFGLIYLLFITFPAVFEETYHFSQGIAGLAFLGLGLGMLIGIGVFGVLSDKLSHQSRGGTVERPELRLILMMWAAPIMPIGFLWYGWTAYHHEHWILPILGTFFIGFSGFLVMMPVQIYIVDVFGSDGAASALAANTVLRNIAGAFLPLAGPRLYENLGLGWGNSLLAFLGILFIPVPFLFYHYGEHLRTRFVVKY
ncbi:major facilitator superfamily domain-containing protein [Dendryphion nanum]|uniref:Major facilitator superfamily domain-containing protein n=1 Tax=Dendryphion nanum TaxID=256645 RepID=A0A9P9IBX0_9PLEO|nr:major facilitator superfamily domain-containing protein [Dendryphion nanum]